MSSKLIFEKSKKGRVGYSLPKEEIVYDIPQFLLRSEETNLPEVNELEVVRHYTNLSKKNYGVEQGIYPLGSCTMKYNPKINEEIATNKMFTNIHPLQPESTTQGSLEIYYETARMLSEVTGMKEFSLNPFAGAQGELTGLMIMKEYHVKRGDTKRNKVLIPDSAHGTNPASVNVAGMEVVEVLSNPDGTINIDSLKANLNDEIAGIMLTNPNTLGIFEKDILEIEKLVHDNGSLLYYDGANLNALLGVVRPGDMGFDIIHINIHKTFSTPHGGGGPGSGPVGVKEHLVDLLPNPRVMKENGVYKFYESDDSIGRVSSFYGNFLVYLKAYTYFLTLGYENINQVGPLAVLNTNYIKESLKDHYQVAIPGFSMHEVVFSGLKDKSISTLDVAKRMIDYGIHPPTIYFPLIVSEALMVEAPETESKEDLDNFIDILIKIAEESKTKPEVLKQAPVNASVRRLDEATAARHPVLKYKDIT